MLSCLQVAAHFYDRHYLDYRKSLSTHFLLCSNFIEVIKISKRFAVLIVEGGRFLSDIFL
jgi:hypothetical protein